MSIHKTRIIALAAGAVLFIPAVANANLMVNLQDVNAAKTAQFSVAYTPSSAPGLVLTAPGFGGSGSYTNDGNGIITVGNFTIGLTADGYVSSGTSILGFTSLNITNLGGSTDTLNVSIGATSFPSPGSLNGGLSLTDSIGGEVTTGTLNLNETSYADPANGQNTTTGLTTPVISLVNFTPNSAPNGSFALNSTPPSMGSGFNNPYSLTNVVSIILTPSGQASLSELNDNGNTVAVPHSAPAPEPATAALFGVGSLSLLRRKKSGGAKK